MLLTDVELQAQLEEPRILREVLNVQGNFLFSANASTSLDMRRALVGVLVEMRTKSFDDFVEDLASKPEVSPKLVIAHDGICRLPVAGATSAQAAPYCL